MKVLWLILSLIPASFFFHFYEFGQHIRDEDASFLFTGSAFFVVVTGILSGYIKIAYVILVNIIAGLFSLLLAMYLIPDDGWFKPVGRDGAVIFLAVVLLIGQLIIRSFSKPILMKKE